MFRHRAASSQQGTVRILIAENIPSLNKGEETIFGGMLESFKAVGTVEVSMFSHYPDVDSQRYGSTAKIVDLREFALLARGFNGNGIVKVIISCLLLVQHLGFLILYAALGARVLKCTTSAIWGEYIKSDVAIIGHDGAFGMGAGISSPFLFYPVFAPFFFKALGKYVVLYGGDVHPFGRFPRLVGSLYKLALNRMDLITLRDRLSCQNLKALGVRNSYTYLTADLAFLLQPASPKRVAEIIEREDLKKDGGPLIGMTVINEIAPSAFPSADCAIASYDRHVAEFANVVDALTHSLNAKVVFVPHCIGVGEALDDRIVAEDIRAACQGKDRVKVITREYSAAELKGLLGQFDLFVGERLHSVINAMSMNVPSIFVALTSDQRSDILKMAGQENALYVVENLDAMKLLQKINETWLKRVDISEQLRGQMSVMREKALLNGQLLDEHLRGRPG